MRGAGLGACCCPMRHRKTAADGVQDLAYAAQHPLLTRHFPALLSFVAKAAQPYGKVRSRLLRPLVRVRARARAALAACGLRLRVVHARTHARTGACPTGNRQWHAGCGGRGQQAAAAAAAGRQHRPGGTSDRVAGNGAAADECFKVCVEGGWVQLACVRGYVLAQLLRLCP